MSLTPPTGCNRAFSRLHRQRSLFRPAPSRHAARVARPRHSYSTPTCRVPKLQIPVHDTLGRFDSTIAPSIEACLDLVLGRIFAEWSAAGLDGAIAAANELTFDSVDASAEASLSKYSVAASKPSSVTRAGRIRRRQAKLLTPPDLGIVPRPDGARWAVRCSSSRWPGRSPGP